MPKPPPNLPEIGDNVRLRGRPAWGVIENIDARTLWSRVAWAEGALGPKIVHLHELVKD